MCSYYLSIVSVNSEFIKTQFTSEGVIDVAWYDHE